MRRAEDMTDVWTTEEGKEIEITNMTENHLENTINMLERWAERKRLSVVSAYLSTPGPNNPNTIAYDCWENKVNNAVNSTYEDYLPEIYWKMREELEGREG